MTEYQLFCSQSTDKKGTLVHTHPRPDRRYLGQDFPVPWVLNIRSYFIRSVVMKQPNSWQVQGVNCTLELTR